MKKEEVIQAEVSDPRFSREQILQSKTYSDRKDVVSAVLKSDKDYSLEEVDALIDDFMKGKVNK